MITPSEALGLSGATLETRTRQALAHLSDATLARIDARLREDTLRHDLTYEHGGVAEPIRIMLRPLLVTPEQLAYVHRACERLLDALKRLPGLYLEDPRVRRAMRVREDEEAWLRDAWSPALASLNPIYGRLDAVCDFRRADWRESLQFLEPNLSGVGGIHFTPLGEQLVMRDVVPAVVAHDPGLAIGLPPDQRELLLQLLLDHAQALGRPTRNLCLVDPKYSSDGPNEQPALTRYCRERHGVTVVHAEPRELRVAGDEVYAGDVCVDVLYRDYDVRSLIALGRELGHELDGMRLLFRQNRVVSSIGGDFDHKSCWEVFTDDALASDHFSPEERRLFHRHVPWTRLLSERRTTLPRGEGDLPEYVRRHREQLVLKPNRAYGGAGVHLGAHTEEGEWETLLAQALAVADDPERSWVVQEAASLPVAEFPVVDAAGRVHEEPFFVVYGFAPTDEGVGTLCRVSQKAVVNVAQHGGLAALLIGHPPPELSAPRRRTGHRRETEARLRARIADLRALDGTLGLLGWDEETYLPEAARADRGAQMATVESLRHRMLVDDELGDLVEQAAQGVPPGSRLAAEIDHLRRLRRIALAQPDDLVRAFARSRSRALEAWERARAARDFGGFSSALSELLGLVRERAECLRCSDDLYDGLLDEHEPGMRRERLEPVLADLAERLAPLCRDLAARSDGGGLPPGHYPEAEQEQLCRQILQDMGFDFRRGRVDRSTHPFTLLAGDADVRLTIRLDEGDPLRGVFAALHEGGHALYDQGFDPELRGTLLAEGASLGLHEAQSRLWENHVGRTPAFWEHYLPVLRRLFPSLPDDASAEGICRRVNAVRTGPVRVTADEVTYNLHIVLRYRLELSLLGGELAVEDLPAAWAEQSALLLGVRPADDLEGCLQDVHWALGSFGYFPSYTLGNLQAAQLMEAFLAVRPAFDRDLRSGDLSPLLTWLRRHVHCHGRRLPADAVLEAATGKPLDPGAFFRLLSRKHA